MILYRHQRGENRGYASKRGKRQNLSGARRRRLRRISSAISSPRISGKARIKAACTLGFRRSPTVICISATPNRSASISVWRRSSAANAICVSTTPTRARKTSNTSTRSKKTCAGWASTGASGNFTRRTILSSSIEFAVQLDQERRGFCL